MKRPALISQDQKNSPVLIVDKFGILGRKILDELSKELLVVFVSGEKNPKEENLRNLICIPYPKKFPAIPDNIYSHIILFDESDPGIKESLSAFVKKAKEDESILIYSSYLSNNSLKIGKKITDSYKRAKAIIYGDIFGKDKALAFKNPINSVIRQVIKDKKIKIPNDGLTQVRPVLLDDTASGILQAIFGGGKSRIFFIFQKNPISLISFTHILQKKDPMITIDFIKSKKEDEEKEILIEGEYLIDENYKIENKLKEIDLESQNKDEETDIEEEYGKEEKKKMINVNFFYSLFFIAFIIILPLLSTLLFSSLGFLGLSYAKKNIEEGNFTAIVPTLKSSNYFLNTALYSSKTLEYEAGMFGLKNKVSDLINKVQGYQKLLLTAEEISYASSKMERVFKGQANNPENEILLSLASYKNSLNLLEEARIDENIDDSLQNKIKDFEPVINMSYNLHDAFLSLINPTGKKTYLILFQNNMELRPGGGFIGSYGILSLDRGKFVDFSIHDVYDADGQLKGHVEPPYPIRRYLPLVHWYLRDSNFDVDFTKSASSAAFLLFQETGQNVDGVIGADVSFVRELIGALGEINVPEYNQKVNKNNFFDITQVHAEKDFFPSSTQKKDFLSALFKALKNNLSERKNLPYPNILKAATKAVSEKHIVFAFSDNSIQSIFSANNWSSSLLDNRKTETFNDFFGINEANIGVNKSNFFIGRSVKYDVSIKDDSSLTSSATLNLKNSSTNWPGGDYKAYVRFITPYGSSLSSIVIDGVTQTVKDAITDPSVYEAKNFKPPSGLEVERYNENGKTIFGFLVIVPAGKLKSIVFNYALFSKISMGSSSPTYSLKVFKQPGTEGYPLDFLISYPSSFSISSMSQQANVQDSRAVISENMFSDENIVLSLSKK